MEGRVVLYLLTIAALFLIGNGHAEWIHYSNSSSSAGGSGVSLYSTKCNIERRTSMSMLEFITTYERNGLPVIIMRDPNTNALFQQMCQREYLLQNYSNVTVTLSTANTNSYKKHKVKLGQYITEMVNAQDESLTGVKTYILFGDTEISELESLLQKYVQPQFFSVEPSLSWGIAGSGTGVPFHRHGPVFNEVIYGFKRWFLYPPDIQPLFDGTQTTLHWLKTTYASPSFHYDQLQECVLGPNEVLYVPDNWWHATLNVGQTVNIATFV